MGTNLLNLFPSFLTSGLVMEPGYGYFGWSFRIHDASAWLTASTLTFHYGLLQR
jgi:hypothetical protein